MLITNVIMKYPVVFSLVGISFMKREMVNNHKKNPYLEVDSRE